MFLARKIKKIEEPFKTNQFEYYKTSAPIRSNLSPFSSIKYSLDIESAISTNTKMNFPLNQILYGPPGTGKTYNAISKAVEIVNGKPAGSHEQNKLEFDRLRKEGQIQFVTFHQNYGYEDFVVGIKPDTTATGLRFDKKEGIFMQIASLAKHNWHSANQKEESVLDFNYVFNDFFSKLIEEEVDGIEINMKSKGYKFTITSIDIDDGRIKFKKQSGGTGHDLLLKNVKSIYEGSLDYGILGLGVYYYPLIDELRQHAKQIKPDVKSELIKNFVLVIDEINRANISKVFGELITLLEEDKRIGASNSLSVTFPNGESFSVPPNLYIVGTMNTADKSIALVDVALRRRFDFKGYYPTKEIIDGLVKNNYLIPEAAQLLMSLNAKIYEKKNSAEYLIGHAYLIKKKLEDLPSVILQKFIPLLMEYFSGKIGEVESVLNNTNYKFRYNTDNFEWTANASV